jgi:GTP cyclohydrolase I
MANTATLLRKEKSKMNERAVKAVRNMLISLGCDLNDPNLKDTPERITKMYEKEFLANNCTEGCDPLPKLIKTFPNNHNFDEIIHLDNIPFTSICSHHWLPFSGLAHLLYMPDKSLIGASKPARIIDFFCRKPQLQENLGIEIVNAFEKFVKPKGVMLYMRGIHSCMSCRGVKTGMNAGMTTSITRGLFRTNPDVKMEALQLIQLSKL